MTTQDDNWANTVVSKDLGPRALERIKGAVTDIMEALGVDLDRSGTKGTPERVAKMYLEIFSGMYENPGSVLEVIFEENHDEMVLVKDIPLYSMCEHHLMPFLGKAHVAYLPNETGQITGLSKIARLVDVMSKRPQVQERLTTQIADVLEAKLNPKGVLVVVEAEHLCMTMRGVKKPGSVTVTSAVRGIFKTDVSTRAEALALIRPGA
ncbi:MAG: GTP cyclohydrolase I FolE [Acidimicrobiia bacterium]